MPQGEKYRPSALVVPEREEYGKKRHDVKRGGPLVFHAAAANPGFASALHHMIGTIETIAAGKAARAGGSMRLGDVRKRGEVEAAAKRAEARAEAPGPRGKESVAKVLAKCRNAKGVRGGFDVEELAELAPELKALLGQGQGKGQGGGARGGAKDGGSSGGADGAAQGAAAMAGLKRKERAGAGGADADFGGAPSGKRRAGGGGGGGRAGAGAGRDPLPSGPAPASLFATDAEVAATFGADFV
jgi:hypothetical protein